MGSPELSASFPESFSAASPSEVHFNIAPQWKTIKDRIREAYYSANNKKRKETFLLFTKVSVSRKKKKKNQQPTAELLSVSLVRLSSVFLFSSPLHSGFCLLAVVSLITRLCLLWRFCFFFSFIIHIL